MNLLFIGDVFGSPGRAMLETHLPSLMEKYDADFIVVNAENASGGKGLTPDVAGFFFDLGVDVLTSGNHIWAKKEILTIIDEEERILRPANYPPGVPGKGGGLYTARNGCSVGVVNVCGRVFLPESFDCPFRALDAEIKKLERHTSTIIVDFHGEATSEKIAAGWYLDGRCSALFGTHTHVQTADETILPGGTAYITDAGMTGSSDGVIGVSKDIILKRFLTQLPVKHKPAKGRRLLSGVFCRINSSGRAEHVERIFIRDPQT